MIHDQILTDLWAVMEENPNNPDQLRVIADRYQELGLTQVGECMRWMAACRRRPTEETKGSQFYSWTSEYNYRYGLEHCRLPICIQVQGVHVQSVREAYELVAVRWCYRTEAGIVYCDGFLGKLQQNSVIIDNQKSFRQEMIERWQQMNSDIAEEQVRETLGLPRPEDNPFR